MATRKTPPPAKKKGPKKPPRKRTRPKSAPRPIVSRPPRSSPDEREAAALRLFAEIETLAGSDVRALAERAAEKVLESFVRKWGHSQVNRAVALGVSSRRLNELLRQPDLDRAEASSTSADVWGAFLRIDRLTDRTRDAVMLTKRHMSEELVAPLVEEVRAAVVSELGPNAARFDFTADVEEGLKLHADHLFLLPALTDLVKNGAEAYPASRPRTPVRLTARSRGRTVEILIADDGYGWYAESLAHAFVPFGTSKPEGTGLGLYLARRAVEDHHGGRITLESKGRHCGTLVRVVLPRRHSDVQPRRRLTTDEIFDQPPRATAAAGQP